MKKYKTFLLVLLAVTVLAASCKKEKTGKALTELEKLPPLHKLVLILLAAW